MFETTDFGVAFTKISLIRSVGQAVGITEADFLTPAEIRASLAQRDPETSQLLEAFLDAFGEWFDIAKAVESGFGRSARIEEEYASSSEKRDQRRIALQTRLRVLKAERPASG